MGSMETAGLTVAETPGPGETSRVSEESEADAVPVAEGLRGSRWWAGTALVLALALAALVPTTGDFGLTWDEPAYRYSQVMSAQWWEQLCQGPFLGRGPRAARSRHAALLLALRPVRHQLPSSAGRPVEPGDACGLRLLDEGHPGAADGLGHRVRADDHDRLFGFLARRYGAWVGLVAAGSLLLMPRLYGQAHLIDTDTPGLLLWAATALAFWKGLHERTRTALAGARRHPARPGVRREDGRGRRAACRSCSGWSPATCPARFTRPGGRADWIDGVVTSGLMLAAAGPGVPGDPEPAAAAAPARPDRPLRPSTRRATCRARSWRCRWRSGCSGGCSAGSSPGSPVWGVERPALETWTAILAFAPVVGWLGNPAWWRETLPRLAHYYTLSSNRRGALPDIQIIYFGQIYEYSLPWHNAWVLMGITVPVTILLAGGDRASSGRSAGSAATGCRSTSCSTS